MFSRRKFLTVSSLATSCLGGQILLPAWARSGSIGMPKNEFDLVIQEKTLLIAGREASAITINGSVPGPLLRMREGEEVRLRVRNELRVDSSLHWHGILLPPEMDGVPGISFDGIGPGETFEYRYRLKQTGTYWYHSHSGLQEQAGVYAPLVVDPRDGHEPFHYDREFILVLSDWSFEDPARLYDRLKKQSDYYDRNQPTLMNMLRGRLGARDALRQHLEWSRMRMSPSDIADVTGATYSYLLNGHAVSDDWSAQYIPGERIRLRLVNASAMTYFNFRIPGLSMTVVEADGQAVAPLDVQELQLATAETYDVLIEPRAEKAYGLMAESMDRSGYAFGTLTPNPQLAASPPPLRQQPQRSMEDMGHGSMNHEHHAGGNGTRQAPGAGMQHLPETQDPVAVAPTAGDHRLHGDHKAMDTGSAPSDETRFGQLVREPGWTPKRSVEVANIVTAPKNRLAEPGTGLRDTPHRVLTYADLRATQVFYDQRPPSREITLHLTGNMERYLWSFDGERSSPRTEPLRFTLGERARMVFVNHTMMEHPIHLHGMWMELENGQQPRPRKHTISVKPAERLAVLVTADAEGAWAFHCHLLMHMKAGMMRTVVVSAAQQDPDNV